MSADATAPRPDGPLPASRPVVETLLSHRTWRDFDPAASIPPEHLHILLDCARQAPSWMNGQHYSIIRITDPALRAQLVALQPNNPQIGTCSEFWVWVADLYRASLASAAAGGSFAAVGTPDTLLTASVDVAMAAQNALTAAESLGYVTCPVGGLRLIAPELVTLLHLPRHTFPLFGLCIGKPSVTMRIKPRLPQAAVVFENRYQPELQGLLADYEQTLLDFNEPREKLPWRQKLARFYEKTYAPRNLRLLRQQGFLTHPDGLAEDQAP